MPRLARFVDALGLACDDLWSYYEVAGKPAWVSWGSLVMVSLLLTAGLVA